MQSVEIGKNQAGQRLDKFLHKYLPNAGNGFLYKMLRKKNITLNGKKAEGSEKLTEGDQVCLFFSDETFALFSGRGGGAGGAAAGAERQDVPGGNSRAIPRGNGRAGGQESRRGSGQRDVSGRNGQAGGPEVLRGNGQRSVSGRNGRLDGQGAPHGNRQTGADMAEEYRAAYARLKGIKILYEDEDVLILNKPAGILAQKAAAKDRSINEWMIGYLLAGNPSLEEELPFFRPSVCNRLDRNTSGIVLCGKSLAGLQYLSECLRERTMRKFYLAVCAGELRGEQTAEGYLTKDTDRNRVEITEQSSGEASPIRTVYSPIAAAGGYTLLEVELITGKAHQIRAHLAGIGHPLAGDYKYGSEAVNSFFKKEYGLQHQLLHAARVEFPRGQSGPGARLGGRSFSAPCPADFEAICRGLGLEP